MIKLREMPPTGRLVAVARCDLFVFFFLGRVLPASGRWPVAIKIMSVNANLSRTGMKWFMHAKLPLSTIADQLEYCKLHAKLRRGVVGIEIAPVDELICCAFYLGEDPALAFELFLKFISAPEPLDVRNAEHGVTVATDSPEIEVVAYAQKLERVLNKFMAVTETSNGGITQMATIEGRVKFYDRVRGVRAEAHEIILPNDERTCADD